MYVHVCIFERILFMGGYYTYMYTSIHPSNQNINESKKQKQKQSYLETKPGQIGYMGHCVELVQS